MILDTRKNKFAVLKNMRGMWQNGLRIECPDDKFYLLQNAIYITTGNIRHLPSGSLVKNLSSSLASGDSIIALYAHELNGNNNILCFTKLGALLNYDITTGVVSSIAATGTFSGTLGIDFDIWINTTGLIIDPTKGYFSLTASGDTFTLSNISTTVIGTTLAVYDGCVFIANGRQITNTQSGTYKSFTGDSGVNPLYSPSTFGPILKLYASEGALWISGQNYINTISNLNVTSSNVLVYSDYNISYGIGGTKRSFITWNTNVFFANQYGIWSMPGLVPIKISDDINFIWEQVNLNYPITSALTTVYGIQMIMFNVYLNAGNNIPNSGWYQLYYYEGNWVCLGQPAFTSNQINYITWVDSGYGPVTYGTDGTNIYQFHSNNVNCGGNVIIQTKLYDFGNPIIIKDLINDGIIIQLMTSQTIQSSITIDTETKIYPSNLIIQPPIMTWLNNVDQSVNWVNSSGTTINWTSAGISFSYSNDPLYGHYLGMTINFNYPYSSFGFLHAILMEYQDTAVWKK